MQINDVMKSMKTLQVIMNTYNKTTIVSNNQRNKHFLQLLQNIQQIQMLKNITHHLEKDHLIKLSANSYPNTRNKKFKDVLKYYSELINEENHSIDLILKKLMNRQFDQVTKMQMEHFFLILKKRINFFKIIKRDIAQLTEDLSKEKVKTAAKELELKRYMQLPDLKQKEIDQLEKIFENTFGYRIKPNFTCNETLVGIGKNRNYYSDARKKQ